MKIALVGPELEENLALRYIHASLAKAGHDCRIYDFHAPEQVEPVAAMLAQWRPGIVGMSMVFTARARQYVCLARRLRELGYAGHITAGGHFASFHARRILRDVPAISSILHGEGERAMADLAEHLDEPQAVAGMTVREADGSAVETPARAPLEDLDELPWPSRTDRFDAYLGKPIANVLAGRGCYGHCSFCSIRAWHRKLGGPRLRQRSVEDLADEMAGLYGRGVRIFNFHDDNFFGSDRQTNLRRFEAIRRGLDRRGVGRIAVQIKARPDSVDPEVIGALMEIGLFRVFLGVESNAVAGLKALGRGIRRQQNHLALKRLTEAGLHVTFNLLMFEPDCSMADLHDNIDFIEANSHVPLNFCRVEVYAGTPLQRRLARQGRLMGSYWGYGYRLADPASQRTYEIFREVFTPRNFALDGPNLQAMAVDYNLHVLKHFHPRRHSLALARDCRQAIRRLNANNVELLREICQAGLAGEDSLADRVSELSRRREQFDRQINGEFAGLLGRMERLARGSGAGQLTRAASAAAAAVLVTAIGCGKQTHVYEMVPASEPATASGSVTASAPATAVAPYDPQEAQSLRTALLGKYLADVWTWARTAGLKDGPLELALELSADGSVRRARVVSPDLTAEDARKLVATAMRWRAPRPSRAGTLTVRIPLNFNTHIFEMAPHHTEMAPRDTTDTP